MSEDPIETLIAKHFAGETSVQEEEQLALWLNENEGHRHLYNSFKVLYAKTAVAKSFKEADTDAAWLKVKSRIRQSESRSATLQMLQSRFLRIAAIILLVAVAGSVIFLLQKEEVVPVLASTGNEPEEVVLPDSSTAFLNRNSSIEYRDSGGSRTINMQGEVYFHVKHSNKDFIVAANGLIVKDIGTAFNVNARTNDKVEVLVTEGEVEVSAEGLQPVNMTEGKRSVYDKSAGAIRELSVTDPNILAYKTKVFVFENASLPAVIEKINEVYNTSIILSDNLKQCRITSTFRNESVDTILQIIAEVLQLRIVKMEKQIILEGQACE